MLKIPMPTSFYNWDHDVNVTPNEDILLNLKEYVHRFSGWDLIKIQLTNGIVDIKGKSVNQSPVTLLTLAVKDGREVYGRAKHLGLTANMLEELRQLA